MISNHLIELYHLYSVLYMDRFLHVALFLVGVIQTALSEALNVNPPGFISIDCGSPVASHYHQESGLNYTWDENYINTGTNNNVTNGVKDLYMTVRSFPYGERNCYSLSPLKPDKKYLIRARFLYGNYDGLNTMPQFDVYIGVNLWFGVRLKDTNKEFVKEIIHYSVAESVDVCLVKNGLGVPFISTLELRPLDDSIYNAASNFSINLWYRWDVGRLKDLSDEINDDAYNRLWAYHSCSSSGVIRSNKSYVPLSVDPYQVPNSVLSTACEGIIGNHSTLTGSYNTKYPTTEVYAYWHFAELELLSANDTREFTIFVPHGPGYTFGPIQPKYLQTTTIESGLISLNGSNSFEFSLKKTDRSNHYPILNAVELHKEFLIRYSPTNQKDIDAITAIKNKYTIPSIWQGDPCLPKNTQWDGLTCDYSIGPPTIIYLDLHSKNLSGEIPQSLSKLISLQSLNLANNNFTGKIPKFLAEMPSLNFINLMGNNLTYPIPPQLLAKACNRSITLRLEGVQDPCTEIRINNRRFIIPLVSTIASITILVLISVIFFVYKGKQKQGQVYETLKSRNKRFRYSDIVKITNNFRKIIGRGGFCTVYHGVLQNGIEVAVKILNNTSSAITKKQFCAEAELLTKIHHVNLVTLIGYCEERSNMVLVYEFLSSGSLKLQLSAKNNPLSWKTRLKISIDAAQGLEYLHSGCQPTIIHRDIKPENILLDEMGNAKIADFGLSRFFTTESEAVATTDIAGTLGYIDPEYCRLSTISYRSDIYAFGVVLLELITGRSAVFKQVDKRDQRVHIIKWATEMVERGDISAIVDKRLQAEFSANTAWKYLEIAMACVNLISSQRPRMSEVVADLKSCYACEGFSDQSVDQAGPCNENGYVCMIPLFDKSSMTLSLPDAR